jgi:hypothetical protein
MDLLSETGRPTIALSRQECTELELKLNVSSKGQLWSHIGDILFDYGTGKNDTTTSILLTDYQYSFIQMLLKRATWESCRGL